MTVKASRYLTHVRRLRDPAEPVRGLLDECLGCFPPEIRVAAEPRHESWWTRETRDVLGARNAALCWADRTGTAVTPRDAAGFAAVTRQGRPP